MQAQVHDVKRFAADRIIRMALAVGILAAGVAGVTALEMTGQMPDLRGGESTTVERAAQPEIKAYYNPNMGEGIVGHRGDVGRPNVFTTERIGSELAASTTAATSVDEALRRVGTGIGEREASVTNTMGVYEGLRRVGPGLAERNGTNMFSLDWMRFIEENTALPSAGADDKVVIYPDSPGPADY